MDLGVSISVPFQFVIIDFVSLYLKEKTCNRFENLRHDRLLLILSISKNYSM